jgi:hypothetical protein
MNDVTISQIALNIQWQSNHANNVQQTSEQSSLQRSVYLYNLWGRCKDLSKLLAQKVNSEL